MATFVGCRSSCQHLVIHTSNKTRRDVLQRIKVRAIFHGRRQHTHMPQGSVNDDACCHRQGRWILHCLNAYCRGGGWTVVKVSPSTHAVQRTLVMYTTPSAPSSTAVQAS